MKYYSFLFFLLFSNFSFSQNTPINIGEKVAITNSTNKETYQISIHKTHGYHLTDDPFPVLYVLDGEWHFNQVSTMVDYYAAAHGGRKIPPIIVVGIENNNRNRDMTPTDRPNWAGGKADDFLVFLEKDVIPFVEKNYRAAPYRMLAGYSLTAQFNLYCIAKKSELFQAHFSVSPWLVYDENWMIGEFENLFNRVGEQPKFLQVTRGGLEEELVEVIGKLEAFTSKKSLAEQQIFETIPEADHEMVFLPSLTKGLLELMKDWKVSRETLLGSLEGIEAHYAKVSKQLGYEVAVPEYVLNEVGYYYLGQKKLDRALEVFQRNLALNPNSANVFDSLGDIYDAMEKKEIAYENYKKAVEIGRPMNHASLKWFEANLERLKKELGK